jgi:mannose-1-phosphate guanylyltransferase/mannose-6-phosphate isomerase
MTLIPVILSGGAGTRLWPVSREAMPKPFLSLPDGETLLHKTVSRAARLSEVAEIVTITNREYYFATKDCYAAVGTALPPLAYLLEPFGRNTAPAVAVAALYVAEAHGPDAEMLVLAADHLIHDVARFTEAVDAARTVARTGRLVTFGIAPTRPETGYGYIECADEIRGTHACEVARFVEKPSAQLATQYVAAGNYVWNSGMFCFSARTILAALEACSPDLLASARAAWSTTKAKQDAHSRMIELDAAAFAALPDISIDYAVMEKAGNVAVVPSRFDWSDVGSWQAVSELAMPDGAGNRSNRQKSEHVSIATQDTYVHAADRLVATVGVENLVIVDTPDAVLVAHKDHLQRVKEVVTELKARGHEAYKLHRTVARPWGSYTVLEEGPGFKIKRIEVKPGASLSLQMHHRRSEHWVVVQGTATVTNGTATYAVRPNESTYIPAHTRHRLANGQAEMLAIIEVQCGDYVGEDDIVRFEDTYGRVPEKQ